MRIIGLIFILFSNILYAQTKSIKPKATYLEDQLYIGLTFINLTHEPSGVNQNGFSNSLSLGFIKDIPLNSKGKFALGIGLGYGQNTYFQNIKISKVNKQTVFEKLNNNNFKKNKFKAYAFEIPLELRWRTSTQYQHKFWRFYAGTKLSYAFFTKSKFKGEGTTLVVKGIPEFNNFQYGLTFAAGYGTWNFNLYYGLSDLFSNAKIVDETNSMPLSLRDFRVGLIFYAF